MNLIELNDPQNTDKAGYGAQELRSFKSDVKDRMEIDHSWENNLTTTDADADGRHSKITLPKLSASPTHIADTGIMYTKVVDDITELFYTDSDGNDVQMTSAGYPIYVI